MLLATNVIGDDSLHKSLGFWINHQEVKGCSVPDHIFDKVDVEVV